MKNRNQERVLKVLEGGPRSYSELQDKSGVRPGSFRRVIGTLISSGQVERTDDAKYRLPTLRFLNIPRNDSSTAENDSETDGSDSPTDSSELEGDGSDGSGGSEPMTQEPAESIFRVGKPKTGAGGGLNKTITNPDGSFTTISWAEDRRRKGYVD